MFQIPNKNEVFTSILPIMDNPLIATIMNIAQYEVSDMTPEEIKEESASGGGSSGKSPLASFA